jgi:hypothetical protein
MAADNIVNEVATFLAAGGLGLTKATNLYGGYMPEGAALQVAILTYPGPASEHDLGQERIRYESPRVQIRVHGPDYAAAELMLRNIEALLATIANETLTATYYLAATPIASAFMEGRDLNQRWKWVQSFQFDKAPSPRS